VVHMIEPSKHQPKPSAQRDAIDVGDFVYAATGTRVRRLTMPDGAHWFPAVDVCKELGYTTPERRSSTMFRRSIETFSRQ